MAAATAAAAEPGGSASSPSTLTSTSSPSTSTSSPSTSTPTSSPSTSTSSPSTSPPSSRPTATRPAPPRPTSSPGRPTTGSPGTTAPATRPSPRATKELPSSDQGAGAGGGDTRLSDADLAAQVAEANRIWAALTASNSSLAGALLEMDRLSKQSNALLESLATARDTERAAHTRAADARARLAAIEGRLDRARQVMREWAFSVYTEGDSSVEVISVLDAMLASPDQVGDPMGDLSHLTDERLRSVQEMRELTQEQRLLKVLAADSERQASESARAIAEDKAELDGLVRAQQAQLSKLQSLQAAEIEKAGPVAGYLVGASTPEAKAAAQRLRAALEGSGVAAADLAGTPCSKDEGFYGNGAIPASALCPLWEAPGEALRPRPAAAFNAMSQAYAKETGSPLCVTDSYRSLGEQYAVKAAKGRWAAAPGSSRHGLGMALDLCGGVNDFGAPAHLWMKQNAPLYGWFHPGWASAGGSLPEPWHWEFAG
ncbi:MAG TPA: M15 family metallopeptidase [Dermatophilaceae bacterium]|nr:M15 family metallopeptidase [Dermatophilaceae bacterium]